MTSYTALLISLILCTRSGWAFVQGGTSLQQHLHGFHRLRGGSQIPESQELPGRGPLEPVRPFVPNLLNGKNALVTGGNRGIGEAITVALIKAGAKVWVVARNYQAFEDMVNRHSLDASDETGNVHWVQADLRMPSEAIAGAKKVCLEGMIKQRYGKIVNITSQSAVIAPKAHSAYCASKAAMDGLLHGLVCDLSQHNIQVNNIAPTVAWTDMGIKTWGDPAMYQPMLDQVPMGRFVEPWEIANIVVFLCSDGCTMCVGQTICVDGGFTCL